MSQLRCGIKNGKLEKYTSSGNYGGLICEDAVDFDYLSDRALVVVLEDGRCVKYSDQGQYLGRIVDNGARRVRVDRGEVHVERNGKIERYTDQARYLGAL